MLRRTFLRGLVRQMGSPAVLAATYSNNTEQMASAAVNELQEALVSPRPWPLLGALHLHWQPYCIQLPFSTQVLVEVWLCNLLSSGCVHLSVQTNCLEELTRPAPNHQGVAGRSDWVHIYHSVLPVLSLHQVDEGRVAGALRSACAALVARNNTMFRAAGVAVWEARFRVPGGAWRLLTYCPTGTSSALKLSLFTDHCV